MFLNQRQKAKLLSVNYDFINSLSDERKCYSLSEKTAFLLMALIEPQHWKTRWHSLVGTVIEQDVIDDLAANALAQLMTTEGCNQPECTDHYTRSNVFQFYPHNPFTEPDYTSPAYGVPPFVAITEPSITGLLIGDVITDITRAMGTLTPIYALPATFLELFNIGLPRFRINCGNGSGIARISLLNVLIGGRAVVFHDDDLLGNGTIVELNLDSVAVPPETNVEVIIERKIEGDGEHWIDVVFIPAFNEELPFIFFGGGVRKVELCGFGGGNVCCDGQNELLQQLITTQNAQGALTLELLDDGSAQSFAPNAPETWEGSPMDDSAAQLRGYNALCNAIKSWIGFVLWEQARAISAGASVFAALADHFLGSPERVFTWIPFSIPEIVSDVTVAALGGMINDTEAIERVACCFKRGLRGRSMSQETFANALNSCDFTFPNNDAQIAGIVDAWNNKPENYRAFVRHLTAGRANASETENQCGCCEDGFNWIFDHSFFEGQYPNYTPPSYTRIAENRIEITTFFGNDNISNPDDAQRGFRIYSADGCCFRVRVVSPAIPWIPPAPNGYNVIWIDRSANDDCGAGYNVDLSQFWCTNEFQMRWGATTLAHPFSPTNQKIVLEFDTEGC